MQFPKLQARKARREARQSDKAECIAEKSDRICKVGFSICNQKSFGGINIVRSYNKAVM